MIDTTIVMPHMNEQLN